jgi:hypothetical protein
MSGTDELFKKLGEIEILLREKIGPDGSFDFDPVPVLISLEVTRRMILGAEGSEQG